MAISSKEKEKEKEVGLRREEGRKEMQEKGNHGGNQNTLVKVKTPSRIVSEKMADRILNPQQVAEILNIKTSTLYSHLSRGTALPKFFKIGSQTRWRESAVWRWIEQREKDRKRKNFEI